MNKNRDYRYQLAAVNFLSNISLDGTYQDTNFAYLFENKLKSVHSRSDTGVTPASEDDEAGAASISKPDTHIGHSTPSLDSVEDFSAANLVANPEESMFVGKRVMILSGLRQSILSVLSVLPFVTQKSDIHHNEVAAHRNRRISSSSLCFREALYKIGVVCNFSEEMSFAQFLQPALHQLSSSATGWGPHLYRSGTGAGSQEGSSISMGLSATSMAILPVSSAVGGVPGVTSGKGEIQRRSAAPGSVGEERNSRFASTRVPGSACLSPPSTSGTIVPEIQQQSSWPPDESLISKTRQGNPTVICGSESSFAGSDVPSVANPFVVTSRNMPQSSAPLLLDDPEMTSGRHKTVLKLPFYSTSILEYVKSSDVKRDLNAQFRERYPHIQVTLTKLRSMKTDVLNMAKRLNLDLWIVAQTYVLFERLVYKGMVNKSNRKICCGMVLLLTAKMNDVKGADFSMLREELESYVKATGHELLLYELSTLLALEFSLLVTDGEVLPHLQRILPQSEDEWAASHRPQNTQTFGDK